MTVPAERDAGGLQGARGLSGSVLDVSTAAAYARLGVDHVEREYPNHPGHLLTGPEDLRPPSVLHPVFFGSYDWHSAVHMHWMLLRVLRRFPDLAEGPAIRASFERRFTPSAVAVEARYLEDRPWFERPYGWAWLLRLDAELQDWATCDADAGAGRLAAALAPLTDVVRAATLRWLATSPGPQRAGAHANSAFACCLASDAAAVRGDAGLRAAVADAAQRWHPTGERAAPWLEPSSTDFLSPTLVLADLHRRLLDPELFAAWFERYLGDPTPLVTPVEVPDREDPQTVHLDGLNLSRAWNWTSIAAALPREHPLAAPARDAAAAHAAAGLKAVLHGSYVGSHWLPTFAVLYVEAHDRSR